MKKSTKKTISTIAAVASVTGIVQPVVFAATVEATAEAAVVKAEKTLSVVDYNAAKNLVGKLPAGAKKTALTKRIGLLNAQVLTPEYKTALNNLNLVGTNKFSVGYFEKNKKAIINSIEKVTSKANKAYLYTVYTSVYNAVYSPEYKAALAAVVDAETAKTQEAVNAATTAIATLNAKATGKANAVYLSARLAKVSVVQTVSSVSAISDIKDVVNGTTADKLGLPTTVDVTLSDKTTDKADITWDTTKYVATQAGDQTITGTLSVPAGKTWTLTDAQKTVSVKVTVKEAAMTVSSVSSITATDVTVKLAAKPATALTDVTKFAVIANGQANPVKSIAAVSSDATGVTYKLTLTNSLDKTQGNLTVNGTAPTAKVATGSDYDYDFKVPTINGVEVVSLNQIKVSFSEKMDASAADPSQYSLSKNSTFSELLNGAAIGVLSADKQSVTFTLNANMVPANYTLKVSGTVKDIQNSTTYKVVTGTELYFTPVADQLVDTVAPTLVSGSYNSETKKLTVNFDEKVNYSTVDKTKISLGGVALIAADGLDTATNSQTLVFSLSDATIAKLPTGALSLALADGAVTDIAGTPNAIKAQTLSSISLATPPQLVAGNSSYDENTHILTLKFNEPVKITAPQNITLGGNALTIDSSYNTGESRVLTANLATVATDTVQIELGATDAVKAGIGNNATTTIAVTIPVNTGIVDADATAITQTISKDIAITQDTAKPSLLKATFKNLNNGLYLEFTEPVQVDNSIANGAGKFLIDLGDGNGFVDIAAATITQISAVDADGAVTTDNYSKYVKIDLTTNASTVAGGQIEDKLQAAYNAGQAMKIKLGANAFYDYSNNQTTAANGNAVMADGLTINFVNSLIPTLTSSSIDTKRQLTVQFDARMNKADVENVANYSIVNQMYSNKKVAVLSAVQDTADNSKVYLTVDSDLTDVAGGGSDAYKLTVTNVKSVDGVAVSASTNSDTFQGTPTAVDATAPVIKTGADDGVVLVSNAGKENDTIAVQFVEANGVDKASAENLANYSLVDLGTDGNGTAIIPLTTDSVSSILLSGNTATMTLKTINLQKDHSYKLTVTGVKDIFGNVISTTDNANVKTIAYNDASLAVNDVAFTQNDSSFAAPTALGSVTSNKTTVTIAFGEAVDATTASIASNYRVSGNIPSSVAYDATTNKATFEIPVALAGTNFSFEVKGIKDLAGNVNTNYTTYSTGVIADLTAPTFATTTPIVAVAKDQLASNNETDADVITLTFDSTVDATTATDERNYVVKVNGVALKNDSNVATYGGMNATNEYFVQATAGNTVTITLNNASGAGKINFLKGDTVTVTAANIEDAVGNAMTSATVSAVATAVADAAADGGSNLADGAIATTDVVIATPNTITVNFADDLLVSSVSASDFLVENNVVTKAVVTGAKQVTLTLAAPIQNAATVNVSGSSTFEIKDAVGNVLSKAELFGTNNSVISDDAAPALATVNPTYTAVQVGAGNVNETASTANTKTFTSSNTAVATVNATTGVITPVAAGTTTISYVGKDANGFTVETGSTTVTVYAATVVTAPTVADITVDNGTTTATARALVSGETITWTSGTAGTATINSTTGVVTAVGNGTTAISYTITNAAGVVVTSGSTTITVSNQS